MCVVANLDDDADKFTLHSISYIYYFHLNLFGYFDILISISSIARTYKKFDFDSVIYYTW